MRRDITPLRLVCVSVFLAGLGIVGTAAGVGQNQPPKQFKLTVLYTSRAGGQIRTCNCSKFRYGGYAREATMVAQTAKSERNLVVVEGGDIVGWQGGQQEDLKADVAKKAMSIMGYAAIVPGEVEVSHGREWLNKLGAGPQLPVVLANLKDKTTGKAVVEQKYVIYKTAGGLRVAVIGLISPSLVSSLPRSDFDAETTDPKAAVTQLLPKLRSAADFILVVAHCPAGEARAVAGVLGTGAVICTHTDSPGPTRNGEENIVDARAEQIGKCVFLESGTRLGWTVGRLDLDVSGGRATSFHNRVYFLDRAYQEDPKIVEIYNQYNKQVRELVLVQAEELVKRVEEQMRKHGFDPSKRKRPTTFAGGDSCKSCHASAYQTWAASGHATAMATLQKTNQEYDPECVGCHTTGATQFGGFLNAKQTPELANVQCEACHSPGKSHAADPKADYGRCDEAVCAGCHTTEIDPQFNYETRWKKVEHK